MNKTEMDNAVIIRALDMLAKALAKHNHRWLDEERELYEKAISMLT